MWRSAGGEAHGSVGGSGAGRNVVGAAGVGPGGWKVGSGSGGGGDGAGR